MNMRTILIGLGAFTLMLVATVIVTVHVVIPNDTAARDRAAQVAAEQKWHDQMFTHSGDSYKGGFK